MQCPDSEPSWSRSACGAALRLALLGLLLTTAAAHAVDCATKSQGLVYVLVPEGGGYRLAQVRLDSASEGADLTRTAPTRPA